MFTLKLTKLNSLTHNAHAIKKMTTAGMSKTSACITPMAGATSSRSIFTFSKTAGDPDFEEFACANLIDPDFEEFNTAKKIDPDFEEFSGNKIDPDFEEFAGPSTDPDFEEFSKKDIDPDFEEFAKIDPDFEEF